MIFDTSFGKSLFNCSLILRVSNRVVNVDCCFIHDDSVWHTEYFTDWEQNDKSPSSWGRSAHCLPHVSWSDVESGNVIIERRSIRRRLLVFGKDNIIVLAFSVKELNWGETFLALQLLSTTARLEENGLQMIVRQVKTRTVV